MREVADGLWSRCGDLPLHSHDGGERDRRGKGLAVQGQDDSGMLRGQSDRRRPGPDVPERRVLQAARVRDGEVNAIEDVGRRLTRYWNIEAALGRPTRRFEDRMRVVVMVEIH